MPKHYIPAVGEGAEEALKKGPFGNQVVDVEVVLVDGTCHAVDSSDMAFKTATRMAMEEGLAKADPVLLEPIDHDLRSLTVGLGTYRHRFDHPADAQGSPARQAAG